MFLVSLAPLYRLPGQNDKCLKCSMNMRNRDGSASEETLCILCVFTARDARRELLDRDGARVGLRLLLPQIFIRFSNPLVCANEARAFLTASRMAK